MAITDELRDEVFYAPMEPDQRGRFNAIADRIDAEHEAMLIDARKTVYEGYIELPKDADGEHIHVGDVMDSRVDHLFNGKPFTVRALVLCEDGWKAADGRFGNHYEPDSLHHHAPTVEDLLCEMLDAVDDDRYGQDRIIAEFAAKLRLAESEES